MIAHKYTLVPLAFHSDGFVTHGSQLKDDPFNKPSLLPLMLAYHTQALLVPFSSVLFYPLLS